MPKWTILACAAMLPLLAAKPHRDTFSKYKAVEAYEIRPGILMMPRYSADGQVCEIGLERLHYSPEMIRLDSSLSRKEIDQIVDELVPENERGPKLKALGDGDLILESGVSMTTEVEYENVSILIYSYVTTTSRHSMSVVDNVAATIRWKNRKCE